MKKVAIGLALLVIAVLYAVPALLLWGAQDAMIFPAPTVDRAWLDSEAERAGATPLDLVAEDGTRLYGWHMPATGHKAVLYFHGNAGVVAQPEYFRWLARQGFDVLAVAYRGYPGSEGAPSEEGLAMDARALWAYATSELGLQASQIVVHGRSLGGGVASRLVADAGPAALILESTFTAVRDMAQRQFRIYPVGLLLRHPFDTAGRAGQITCPVLLLHGDADEVIPVSHGRALSTVFSDVKYVEVPGSDHNISRPIGTPLGRRAAEAFLASAVP